MPKKCKTCNNNLYGRSDKLFCCVSCKTCYHRSTKTFAEKVLRNTAKALIRNRTILLELMKSNKKEITVDRSELDSKKFNWRIMSGTHVNSKGTLYFITWTLHG